MSNQEHNISREEVLKAFAIEENPGRDVLMRYLAEYPQYAIDLVDLSRELARTWIEDDFSEVDEQSVEVAVSRFRTGGGLISDPGLISSQVFSAAAERFQLPLQAMVAFRERRVLLASIPTQFLNNLALALQVKLEQLQVFLSQPPLVSATRRNKSNTKPTAAVKISFEQVLQDAGVSAARVQELIDRGE